MDELFVAVDRSDGAQRALYWAVHEARLRQNPLTVLHVLPSFDLLFSDTTLAEEDVRDIERAVVRRVDDVVEAMLDACVSDDVTVTKETVEGASVSRVLIDRAAGSSGLVVGTRGRGGFGRLLLGSVSQQVVQHARCPVVVVPMKTEPPGGRKPRVIVGVDGSPAAVRALSRAAEEARIREATLQVVVAQPPLRPADEHIPAEAGFAGGRWAELPPLHESMSAGERTRRQDERFEMWQRQGEAVLDHSIAQLEVGSPLPPLDRTVVPDEHAAHALLGLAEDAELLVVGSRGRGGFAGMVLGSVSLQCVQHATSPVLVVRPPTAD